MIIYRYHPETGELLGQTEARRDPIKKKPLIPANATDIATPEVDVNETVVFENGGWVVVPDYRGQVYYDKTSKKQIEISELNVSPEANCTDTPPPDVNHKWGADGWVVDIDLLKSKKVKELSINCGAACEAGYTSNAAGSDHFYRTDRQTGQLNLLGHHLDAMANSADPDWTQKITCVPEGESTSTRVAHTVAQTLAVTVPVKQMIEGHRTIYNDKKHYVLNLDPDSPTIEEDIAAVTWESVEPQ